MTNRIHSPTKLYQSLRQVELFSARKCLQPEILFEVVFVSSEEKDC